MNFVYALFIPLGIVMIFNAIFRAPLHKHHVTVLGLAIGLILTATLTDLIKNMVGRPRPDLLARCKPAPGTPEHTLVTIDVCTEKEHHRLHDGWRSFPSGHSSFSFAGLGYLSLFLAGQLKIFVLRSSGGPASGDEGTGSVERVIHARGDLGRALFCLLPLLGATTIAISRCQDYRHDVYDVSIGAGLGWIITYWSYRRYWPRLGSSRCDEPYPGPNLGTREAATYGRLRDEEEGGHSVGYELANMGAP
jgi:diacylglycerol diphosphate phosphatase / phosphatidate phosphatase